MRALTIDEIHAIAGGLKMHPMETLSEIHVTGTPSPPPPGVNGGGGGGTSGGGGSGGGTGGLSSAQEAALAKGLAEELQVLALHGEIPSDWVETGVNIGDLAAGLLADDFAGGEASWRMYQATGSGVNAGLSYANAPIDWNYFNWAEIPGAATATSYGAAVQDAVNWAQSKGG